MSLSEHIKQKRKKNGLSQVELAERAGVGLRFVRDLEQGKQTLRMDKVNDVLEQECYDKCQDCQSYCHEYDLKHCCHSTTSQWPPLFGPICLILPDS